MNILLLDQALPSSVFSGKTVRLKHIYGKLAEKHTIHFIRTGKVGIENESEELELWAKNTFATCSRISPQKEPSFVNKILNLILLRPWFDLRIKHKNEVEDIRAKLNSFIKNHNIDVLVTFCFETAPYAMLLNDIPWIQDLGDSMVLQTKRNLRASRNIRTKAKHCWRLIREVAFERETIRSAKKTIFVAEDDAEAYRNSMSSRISIMPNGVDTDYFDPEQVEALSSEVPYVVFTGHMSYRPNIDTACYFAKKILPAIQEKLPQVKFYIVGADPSEEVLDLRSLSGIEVTGRVEDLRPYLKSAAVYVSPMRLGSGIKNKILEAMSMKLPIVASTHTWQGFEERPEIGSIVTDEPDSFAKAVLNAIQNKKREDSLRSFVIKNHSWIKLRASYESLLDSVRVNSYEPASR